MSTTISNREIKLIKSLSTKKFRDLHGYFVIEGEKLVEEGEKSNFEIIKIFKREDIGEQLMSKISFCKSPSPVLAIVKKQEEPFIKNFEIKKEGLYIALDGLRDPGNLGTIIRIADWFGITAIFASKDTVDVYNPKVVQATMGAIFRVPVIYTNLDNILEKFCPSCIYGTFLQGKSLYNCKLHEDKGAKLIIIGNESNGISKDIEELISKKITIPSYSLSEGSESLNAAIATSIVIAEFQRQLNQ